MLVVDAQKEVRTVYAGGFFGQLVSAALWLISAALATWASPRAAILEVVLGGFFIFPLTQLLLRLAGRRASLGKENPLRNLAIQLAFGLSLSMLLLAPVTAFHLQWFYPALMVLVGAHYLPFTFLYGMRMFLPLAGILICGGVAIAELLPNQFSTGGWVAGIALLIFAVIGRASVARETAGSATK
jgi:hypothetical protein